MSTWMLIWRQVTTTVSLIHLASANSRLLLELIYFFGWASQDERVTTSCLVMTLRNTTPFVLAIEA